MDKKILMLMVALVVVAVMVFAVVLIASGGMTRAGGFTKLFDKFENEDDTSYNQWLKLPDSWDEGDKKTVSDTIVDMRYHEESRGFLTTLWFVYRGDKWNDPEQGTLFHIPDKSHDGWSEVRNGLFSVQVWSLTNLSSKYDVGDTITIETVLDTNVNVDLAFGGEQNEWTLASE